MKRIKFHAMGSGMMAALDSTAASAERALESLPDWFQEWEQVLSRFRPDSELSRMNCSMGEPASVSETFWDVFQTALEVEQETAGVVSPTILDALVHAGYDRPFDLLPASASPAADVMLEPLSLSSINQDAGARTLTLPAGLHLDFGGVAKGWSAQKAASRLQRYGPALVDAGGDIAVSGPPLESPAWSIGVLDPFHPEEFLETLRVEEGGVATSGIDYHRWQQGDRWNHHIIDPRTGLPAVTDLLTVTIVAPSAIRAEAAAKYVLISGSAAGLEWLEADPTLAGLLILQSGERLTSRRMQEYLWRDYDRPEYQRIH